MKMIIFDLDGTLLSLSPTIRVFADKSLLKSLKNKYRLGIITGSSYRELDLALRETGLAIFFDPKYIITDDSGLPPKNTGSPFKRLLKINNDKAVIIGDSLSDKLGAEKSGVPFALVKKSSSLKTQRLLLKQAIKMAEEMLEK